jgi:hypothetical protein
MGSNPVLTIFISLVNFRIIFPHSRQLSDKTPSDTKKHKHSLNAFEKHYYFRYTSVIENTVASRAILMTRNILS